MSIKEKNLTMVIDKMNSEQLWDDIYVNIAETDDGETYAICDDWDSHNKFIEVVKEVIGNSDDEFNDWSVEIATGIIMVFSDSCTTCNDCGNVIQTEPNSYHWQPDFYVGDGFIACNKCFNDTEDYQEEYIEERVNNPKEAVNGLMTEKQIKALGFEKLETEYENGWYHTEDNPEEIYEKLSEHYDEVLFFINNVEQFRLNFVVFVRGEIEREDD